ncbi:MAG TPA: zf-TFIIB domain-containing protein [Gaiellaceae bacterium]|nr:zf-TFIIB domain-containing protein [Gaiellaceae bacterium]
MDDNVLSGRALQGTELRCPADGSRLVEVERAEIHIDACPACRGVWLDRGELDRILVKERQLTGGDDDFFDEVEGGRARPRGARRDDDRSDDDFDDRGDRKRPRRRRGLLEELLDFG